MKVRSDFISNSSSSSFIVKAEPGVPEIFASGEKYGFGKFAEQNLRRDVFGCFDEACWGWRWNSRSEEPVRNRVRLIPDAEFARRYSSAGIEEFTLPESCGKYVDAICEMIERVLDIDAEKPPELWSGGERSAEMTDEWNRARHGRMYEETDRLDEVINKAYETVIEILRPVMGDWDFYYAELEDSNGDEQKGLDATGDVPWYRVFSNH